MKNLVWFCSNEDKKLDMTKQEEPWLISINFSTLNYMEFNHLITWLLWEVSPALNLIIKDDRHLHISKFLEQTFLPRQGLREEAPTGYLINWILYIKRLMFRWQFYVMGFFRKFRKTFDMVLTIYKNIYNSLTVIFPL